MVEKKRTWHDDQVKRMVSYKARRCLSDEKFARVIGVPKNTVSRWRVGKSKAPSGLLALALAHLEYSCGLSWVPAECKHVSIYDYDVAHEEASHEPNDPD